MNGNFYIRGETETTENDFISRGNIFKVFLTVRIGDPAYPGFDTGYVNLAYIF